MTLDEIKAIVDRLAARIGATELHWPTYGRQIYDACPYIEIDEDGYHWVVKERGREFERVTTRDIDELLFTVFQSITSEIASNYEAAHRVDNQDFRRVYFQRQEELMSQLSPQWGERAAQRHAEILQVAPYNDSL